jgi:hypothetical protein
MFFSGVDGHAAKLLFLLRRIPESNSKNSYGIYSIVEKFLNIILTELLIN